MEEEKKLMGLGKFIIKNKTAYGDLAKTITYVYSDGRVLVVRIVLSSDADITGYNERYARFGKYLYSSNLSFKYETLACIIKGATDILKYHKVKSSDILR